MSDDTGDNGVETTSELSGQVEHTLPNSEGQRGGGTADSEVAEAAEKTRKLAELAGGGSNKGSFAGSNEDLDQAGGHRNG